MPKLQECKFYCTATGAWTATECLHCDVIYCQACNYGSRGIMLKTTKRGCKLLRCGGCGKNPKVKLRRLKPEWIGGNIQHSKKVRGQPHCAPVGPYRRQEQEKALGPNAVLMHILREDGLPLDDAGPEEEPQERYREVTSPKGALPENVFDRLTDPRTYHATHRRRFSADGTGLGMDGRRDDITGIPPRSDPLKYGKKKISPVTSPRKTKVFDKLTDPAQYTGTHKHRFDDKGAGRGMEGRKDDDTDVKVRAGMGTITRDDEPALDTPNRPISAIVPAAAKAKPRRHFHSQDAFTDEVMITGVFSRLTVEGKGDTTLGGPRSPPGSGSKARSPTSTSSFTDYDAYVDAQKPFTVPAKVAALHSS